MTLISIAVPVYHNAASLPDLYAAFTKLADQNATNTFEFIFVDDGSADNSFQVLSELAAQDHRVRALRLSRNFGSNAAILAGLTHAKGDAVGVIAADLQDPPELLHEMLEMWRNGRKVVLAARKERDDPGLTSIMADTFYMLFRRFAIRTMPKRGFDFFLIDRQVCDLIKNMEEANAYLMGQLLWVGFDPAVVYYNRRAREARYGHSMWTFAKKLKYFVDSFVAFSHFPVRLTSGIGIALSILGFLYAALVIIARIFFNVRAEGWASLMVVLLLVSGVQMLMLGIIGEYIWRNLDETRKRPRFIIDRIIDGADKTNPPLPAESASRPGGTLEQ